MTIDCNPGQARPLIIIMAKVPAPGQVKTRLAPLLSANQCAQISIAFLRDTLRSSLSLTRDVMLAYSPASGEEKLREILAPDSKLAPGLWLAQRGKDLSARLNAAAARGFELGFAPVFLIGADSPTLPPQYLQRAIQSLAEENCDIVLGPTPDGGFYALGLKSMQRNLYRNVAWSTPSVLAQTLANAEKLDLRVELLPEWHDVDTPADLQKLRHHLQKNEIARETAPHTFAWIRENQFSLGP